MLILSRMQDEEIVIDGGRITIRVCSIRGDRVRIGVEAPKDVAVNRREIHDEIVRQWGGQGG